jgi:hypothetical protein
MICSAAACAAGIEQWRSLGAKLAGPTAFGDDGVEGDP